MFILQQTALEALSHQSLGLCSGREAWCQGTRLVMSHGELVASCYCNCLSKVRRHSDLLEARTVCLTFVSEALSYRYAVRVTHTVLFLEHSLHSLETFVATSNNEP